MTWGPASFRFQHRVRKKTKEEVKREFCCWNLVLKQASLCPVDEMIRSLGSCSSGAHTAERVFVLIQCSRKKTWTQSFIDWSSVWMSIIWIFCELFRLVMNTCIKGILYTMCCISIHLHWSSPWCGKLELKQISLGLFVPYIQYWCSDCYTTEVLSRGHPSLCVLTPSAVHSQDGESTYEYGRKHQYSFAKFIYKSKKERLHKIA